MMVMMCGDLKENILILYLHRWTRAQKLTLECNGGGDLPAKYDNNSSLRIYLRRLLLAQSANSLVLLWYPYCTAASFVRFIPSQDSFD